MREPIKLFNRPDYFEMTYRSFSSDWFFLKTALRFSSNFFQCSISLVLAVPSPFFRMATWLQSAVVVFAFCLTFILAWANEIFFWFKQGQINRLINPFSAERHNWGNNRFGVASLIGLSSYPV